jgi:hypothetical protein
MPTIVRIGAKAAGLLAVLATGYALGASAMHTILLGDDQEN